MRVCVLADLPGRSVATTSMWMTKLELVAKVILKTNFYRWFSAFRKNKYLLTKLEHRILRESTVHIHVFN